MTESTAHHTKILMEHQEKFAAAFLKETGLNATEVVMNIQQCSEHENGFNGSRIWFEKKTESNAEIENEEIEKLRHALSNMIWWAERIHDPRNMTSSSSLANFTIDMLSAKELLPPNKRRTS